MPRCACSKPVKRSAAECAPRRSRFPASPTTSAPAVTRMGALSPWFRTLPLAEHGLRWIRPPASVAHPLDDEPAVLLRRSLRETASELGRRCSRLRDAVRTVPARPARAARRSARAARAFRSTRSRWPASGCPVCFRQRSRCARDSAASGRARCSAGCAAHSILPLERPLTAAVGMIFALTAHVEDWPVAAGGSQAIAGALASYLRVARRHDRDRHGSCDRSRIFPRARRAVRHQPGTARRHLRAGPAGGLRSPAPPLSLRPRRRSSSTGRSTGRSRGATRAASRRRPFTSAARSTRSPPPRRAVWRGEHPERPFVLVVQQSQFDPTPRAGRQAHRLRLLPRSGRLDGRLHRRDRAADRALRARLPRSHPRAPHDAHRRSRARQPELRRRRDHRRRRRPVPVLHATGGAARSLLDAEPAPVPLLGVDAARAAACTACAATSRRAARRGGSPGESCGDCCRVGALRLRQVHATTIPVKPSRADVPYRAASSTRPHVQAVICHAPNKVVHPDRVHPSARGPAATLRVRGRSIAVTPPYVRALVRARQRQHARRFDHDSPAPTRYYVDCFFRAANPDNGLIADNSREGAPCSIAATGLGLAAYIVGAERGFLPRREAAQRTLAALRFFRDSPQGEGPDVTGHRGFYYHFLDMKTGRRIWQCELSIIDTAILIAGALTSGRYFSAATDDEREYPGTRGVPLPADRLALGRRTGSRGAHGWKAGAGFLNYGWEGYSEAMLLYVLGLGSPTHPLPAGELRRVDRERISGRTSTTSISSSRRRCSSTSSRTSGSTFAASRTTFMREKRSDYFENSRRATAVQQQYALRNPMVVQGIR